MVTYDDWKQFFPLKEPRPEQITAINFIIETFKDHRFAVVEAPVGIGKSAIALTIAQYYQHNPPKQSHVKSSYIITTQRLLQEQYTKDFPKLANLWSKQNYKCENIPGVSCQIGLAIKKAMKVKDYSKCCKYNIDKDRFESSQMSITNTSFLLHNIKYNDNFERRKILICDECHTLEPAITGFVSLKFTRAITEEYIKIRWNGTTDIKRFTDWVLTDFIQGVQIRLADIKEELKNAGESYLQSKSGKDALHLKNNCENYIGQIGYFREVYKESDWVLTTGSETQELKPLYAKNYSNDVLFNVADKVLLMSGTILNSNTFCNNLGVPVDNMKFLSLNSPFPVENRPIFIVNVGPMGYNDIQNTLPKMAKAVKEIMDMHKDVKGIIHAQSYKISDYLYEHINDKRLLVHKSDDRSEILNEHIRTMKPTVLLSPSFTEGVDLKEELSRFQIICKIPYPYLGDTYIKTKMDKIPNWYVWETIKTILQSCGRSVRSEQDHAYTYILDSTFNNLYNRNMYLFPKWWRDSLIYL